MQTAFHFPVRLLSVDIKSSMAGPFPKLQRRFEQNVSEQGLILDDVTLSTTIIQEVLMIVSNRDEHLQSG